VGGWLGLGVVRLPAHEPNRAMRRRIEADTCGLGRWEEPEGWSSPTFSHTVTLVDGNADHWLPYVCGCTVALAVQPADEPFTRGAAYVWCKRVTENGNVLFPTSPLFGRFIANTSNGPKVLAGEGKSEVVGPEYVYCFRAVGVLHGERQFFPRSEVPTPIPSSVVRQDQPAAFDLLQHGVKALDNALQAMANVIELIDDVDDADKRSDNDKYLDRRYRKAQAYEALDHLLTTALDKSATLQRRVADYHKASPELAHFRLRLPVKGGGCLGWLPHPNAVAHVDPLPAGAHCAPPMLEARAARWASTLATASRNLGDISMNARAFSIRSSISELPRAATASMASATSPAEYARSELMPLATSCTVHWPTCRAPARRSSAPCHSPIGLHPFGRMPPSPQSRGEALT
jgi:hypothetical protein